MKKEFKKILSSDIKSTTEHMVSSTEFIVSDPEFNKEQKETLEKLMKCHLKCASLIAEKILK